MPKRNDQQNQHPGNDIGQRRKPFPEMIRDIGHHHHHHKSQDCGKELLFQIMGGISIVQIRLIRTGGKYHDHTKP